MKNIIRKLILKLNFTSELPFKFCNFFIDASLNNNNSNMLTNGEREVIKKFLRSCDQLFDIGAGDGEYINLALKFNQKLLVFAFEPSQRILNMQNNLNIKKYNIGIASAEGNMDLYLDNQGGAPSFVASPLQVSNKNAKIQIKRFDSIIEANQLVNKNNFVKIDVEGFELEVLKSMDNYISQGLFKYIQFEYSSFFYYNNIRLKDVFDYVKSLNTHYDLYKIFPYNCQLISEVTPQIENYKDSNYLFILEN